MEEEEEEMEEEMEEELEENRRARRLEGLEGPGKMWLQGSCYQEEGAVVAPVPRPTTRTSLSKTGSHMSSRYCHQTKKGKIQQAPQPLRLVPTARYDSIRKSAVYLNFILPPVVELTSEKFF